MGHQEFKCYVIKYQFTSGGPASTEVYPSLLILSLLQILSICLVAVKHFQKLYISRSGWVWLGVWLGVWLNHPYFLCVGAMEFCHKKHLETQRKDPPFYFNYLVCPKCARVQNPLLCLISYAFPTYVYTFRLIIRTTVTNSISSTGCLCTALLPMSCLRLQRLITVGLVWNSLSNSRLVGWRSCDCHVTLLHLRSGSRLRPSSLLWMLDTREASRQ